MATEVPQRQLRNETASLLRRVEAGEHLRITVHGHPVADLVPVQVRAAFVSRERMSDLRGLLDEGDPLAQELREATADDVAIDPFE